MVMEEAGHFINVECAEQFSKAILRTFHRARTPHTISLNTTAVVPTAHHRRLESRDEQIVSDEVLRENHTQHHDSYFWSWNFVQKFFRGERKEEEQRNGSVEISHHDVRREASLASLDDINKWTACSDPSLVL